MGQVNVEAPLFVAGHDLLDAKYGPYLNTTQCLDVLKIENRKIGQTVGVYDGTGIAEYWFKDGIEDTDLVVKESSTQISEKYIGAATITNVTATGTIGSTTLTVTDSVTIGTTLSVGMYIQLEAGVTIYLIDAITNPSATTTTLTLHTALVDDPSGGKIKVLSPYAPFNSLLVGDNMSVSVDQNVATISATGGGGGNTGFEMNFLLMGA